MSRLYQFRCSLLVLAVLSVLSSQGQNNSAVDSLHRLAMAAKSDSARRSLYSQLTYLSFFDEAHIAHAFNDTARHYAKRVGNPQDIAAVDYHSGIIFRLNGEYDSALVYLNKSLKYYEKEAQIVQTRGPLFNIGVVHSYLGNYETSLEYYYRELKINENIPDSFGMANTLNSIGSAYKDMEDFDLALEKYSAAQRILEKLDSPWDLANVISNTGALYLEQNDLENAEPFLRRALDIDRDIGHEWGMAYNLYRLGLVYWAKNQLDSAMAFQEEALQLRLKLGQQVEIAESMSAMGSLMFESGSRIEGIRTLKDAASLANEIGAYECRLDVENMLSQYLTEMGNHKEAFLHLKQYITLRDSVMNREKVQIIKDLEARYKSEKKDRQLTEKELEITANQARIERQDMLLKGSFAGAAVLLIVVILMAFTIHSRVKLNNERLAVMRKEQEIAALKSMMAGEEKERSRVARELHDGLSSLLAAIKIQFNALQHEEDEFRHKEKFNNALTRLDDASKEVRRIAQNMMPEILMKYGLIEALSEYVAILNGHEKIKFELSWFGMEHRFSYEIEQIVYRAVQELLNNAIKHSGATEVLVQLNQNENRLSITVEDNGRGFELQGKKPKDSIGLDNLSSRINYLNGELNISSTPGSGTSVYIEIDLQNNAETL